MSVSAQDQLSEIIDDLQGKLADAEARIERLQSNIVALFKRGRAQGRECRYCRAPIYDLFHQDTGNKGVYDPDGTSHWATCPNAAQARADMSARKR